MEQVVRGVRSLLRSFKSPAYAAAPVSSVSTPSPHRSVFIPNSHNSLPRPISHRSSCRSLPSQGSAMGATHQKRRPWRTLAGLVMATACFAFGTLSLHSSAIGASSRHAPGARPRGRRLAEQLGLATSPAGLHGPVQKSGPLDVRNWHHNYTSDRREAFSDWLAKHGLNDPDVPVGRRPRQPGSGGSSSTGPPTPPPVFPACQIFVNHRYRFIYLRHAKAASTSLLGHFGFCGGNITSYNSPCMERLDAGPSQRIPADQLEALWREYFVFSFVRNPWNRAVSSYLMMMRSLGWEPDPGPPSQQERQHEAELFDVVEAGEEGQDDVGQQPVQEQQQGQRYRFKLAAARRYGWDDFCADPASFQHICDLDARCSMRTAKHTAAHIQAQLPCLAAAGGGWAVDFLGRVEEIDRDLNAILAVLDARREPGVPRLGLLRKRLGNANGVGCKRRDATTLMIATAPENYCDREQYFQGRHSACAATLRQYYAGDAEAMRFPGATAVGSIS